MVLRPPAVKDVSTQHPRHQLVEDRQVDVAAGADLVSRRAIGRLHHLVTVGLEMAAEQEADAGSVVGQEDASHAAAFWQHGDVSGPNLDRLPPHERRRLLALGRTNVEELARRRLEGEPLQYLEGSAQFIDMELLVDERVLVPRPETEGLYALAISEVENPAVVVDLGTGSGALALALARRFPTAAVHAVDIDADALSVARANADSLSLPVSFHRGDLFEPLPGALRESVDLVVSNPPYVAESDWSSLPADVRQEPRGALVAGPTGTEVLGEIARSAPEWVRPGGLIACEIGETQGETGRELFAGLGSVSVREDLSGKERYLMVRVES